MSEDDKAQMEGNLVRQLKRISDMWDDMLLPRGAAPAGTGTSAKGATLEDAHEYATLSDRVAAELAPAPDVPRIDQVADVRRSVTLTLNGWCRTIVEDHNVHHGIPDGMDVPGMCTFLERWRAQVADHEAAHDILDEIEAGANAVQRIARPGGGRTGLLLGACRQHLGEGVECGTEVRVEPYHLEQRHGMVRCRGCGTEDTTEGWLLRIVGTEGPFTTAQLIPLLHRRLGIRATSEQIRQWVARDIIKPLRGSDGEVVQVAGSNVFGWGHVARQLTERGIGDKRVKAAR